MNLPDFVSLEVVAPLLYCEHIFTHVIKGPEGWGITDEKYNKGAPNSILCIHASIRFDPLDE